MQHLTVVVSAWLAVRYIVAVGAVGRISTQITEWHAAFHSFNRKKSFGVIENVMQQLQKAHAPTQSRRGHFQIEFLF